MKKQALTYLILLGCLILPLACKQKDLPAYEEEAEDASLTLSFRTSNSHLDTRGVEDLDNDGTISKLEEIIDGRRMYRLAVFLVEGNTVIASAELRENDPRFNNENREATVTFTRLHYGVPYRLMAVANYGDYDSNTKGHLATIDMSSDMRVSATDNNLCNKNTPYPLSLEKEIVLQPGSNTVGGELLRTYARIRINVRNQSASRNLKITNLSFGEPFTQSSADLFTPGGKASVQPVVTAVDAVVPFKETLVAPIDGSGNVSESTIFDSYLLESSGGTYNYNLKLEYEGDTETEYTVSNASINNPNSIENGAMYVIYNTQSKRYLYADGTSVKAGSLYNTNGELNHNYVWKFTETNTNNRFYIESMGSSGYFMKSSGVSNNSVPLTNGEAGNDYFTVSSSSGYLRFQATSSSNYYLAVNNSSVYGHSSSSNANRRNFYLYKVISEDVQTFIPHEETIPIRVIDKVSGEAKELTAINRNDFIQILVNITYNEKDGKVLFEVVNWDEANGEITFN